MDGDACDRVRQVAIALTIYRVRVAPLSSKERYSQIAVLGEGNEYTAGKDLARHDERRAVTVDCRTFICRLIVQHTRVWLDKLEIGVPKRSLAASMEFTTSTGCPAKLSEKTSPKATSVSQIPNSLKHSTNQTVPSTL